MNQEYANKRIIELCSASDIVAAQAMCNALEQENIQARVTGDMLGNAAGCLPLGEATRPRIWVHESDAARARDILSRIENNRDERLQDDTQDEREDAVDPKDESLPSDTQFRFLSQGFYIIGLACVMIGIFMAWQNHLILNEHSAITHGQWVENRLVGINYTSPPNNNTLPFSKSNEFTFSYRPQYVYFVNGERYFTESKDMDNAFDYVPIHYKPERPSDCIVGDITPPWVILAYAFGLGAFSIFVGFKFR